MTLVASLNNLKQTAMKMVTRNVVKQKGLMSRRMGHLHSVRCLVSWYISLLSIHGKISTRNHQIVSVTA